MFKTIFKKGYKKGVKFDVERYLKECEVLECEIKEDGVLEDKNGNRQEYVVVKIIIK